MLSFLVSTRKLHDSYVIKRLQIPIIIGCGILFPLYDMPFHLMHLVMGSIVLFLMANALESFVMSHFSKIISKNLAHGVFNSGFLATEAGTFGRTVGNMLITSFGGGSAYSLQRALYGTELIGCAFSLSLVYCNTGF